MNATQLQVRLREVRGTRVSRQTIRNRLHQHGLRARWPARVPDHTTRHRHHRQGAFVLDEEPVGLSAVLWWKSIHIEQKWWLPTLLSGVKVWTEVSSQYRTVNGTVTSQYYLNNIINPVIVPLHEQHRPDFIFMDDNAPAHRVHIIRERLLEAGVLQIEWPALSPDLNPIENLWDQLSRRVEGHNPAPQNLSDLRVALQEEWDAMPQQIISRLVNSMRRCCQAVIDAQGQMASYWDIDHPPLLIAFVSINSLRWRNYHCVLILKCPTFMM